MMDPQGNVTTWNSGAQNIKGYRSDEVLGRHFSLFFTEEDRGAGVPVQALQQAAAQGKFESEGWRVRKDGSRFWASAILDALYDEHGALIGFAKVTRDFTQHHE